MGRLCIHYQLDPAPRLCAVAHGPILPPNLHGILNLLHFGFGLEHANPICGFPAGPDE